MPIVIKDTRRIRAGASGSIPPSLISDVNTLKNNEYKVTYYEIISGTSGSITLPTGAIINENEFGASGNCILSKLTVDNKPSFVSPQTAGGVIVTASLNAITGAYLTSGTFTDPQVALIYSLKISAYNWSNLNYDNIVDFEETSVSGTGGLVRQNGPTFLTDIKTPKVTLSSANIEWNEAVGNYTGTSITQANTLFNSASSIINRGTQIGLSGTTSTNYGYRLDTVGLRIAPISDLHLANSYNLQVNEFYYHKVATNNYTFQIPGAFGGYISWVANNGGSFLTTALDTMTVQSRGTQLATTPIFTLSRGENQNNILYMHRYSAAFNFNTARQDIGGRIDYWLRPENNVANVNSHICDFLWENNITGASERNSYFRFQTMAANALADRFHIRSSGVRVLGKIGLPSSATPGTLVDGDIWYDGSNLKLRNGGVTRDIDIKRAESICGNLEFPTNKTYIVVLKAPHGGTITETTTKSSSGTCTATFKINSTPLGGTANSVSSSEQSQAHASANIFVADDDISVEITSNSSCLDLSFNIKYNPN